MTTKKEESEANRQQLQRVDKFGHFTVLADPEELKEGADDSRSGQKIEIVETPVEVPEAKKTKRQRTRERAKKVKANYIEVEINKELDEIEAAEDEKFIESKAMTTEEAYAEKEYIQKQFEEKMRKIEKEMSGICTAGGHFGLVHSLQSTSGQGAVADQVQAERKVRFEDEVKGIEKKCKKKQVMQISTLGIIEPEGVNAISEEEWTEVSFAVDSGASETVINEDMAGNVTMTESQGSRRGVQYEVANGVAIPNEGEKRLLAVSEENATRDITAQVCNVNKALLSVRRVVAAGNRVVFDAEASYIEDKATGEKMWLKEENGMYMLKMWVKAPFHGPSK